MTRHILHLIDTSTLSGPGKTIYNSCRFEDGSRYVKSVSVFTSGAVNDYVSFLRKSGITAIELAENRANLPKLFTYIPAALELRRIIRERNVDLLHAHGYKADILGLLASRMSGIKIVTTLHGYIENTRSAAVYNRLSLEAAKRMDALIAVSRAMRDRLLEKGVPDSKISVIHNAIVSGDYPRLAKSEGLIREYGIDGIFPVIGSIGRISPEKGQRVLCDAFRKIITVFPNARLLLIGDGPDAALLKGEFPDLDGRLVITGHVKNIKEYISVLDLHVLASYTEGLPNVVLETSCMGKANVATDVGGTSECLINGKTGILVRPGESAALAEAALKVLKDPRMRSEFEKNAFEFIRKEFDFTRRVEKMHSLYDRVFSGGNACALPRQGGTGSISGKHEAQV
ncbi:MAG: glycosyltransferase [Thermodesulfobacteriota bacterium]|nr:MAG: glycosyltransferase [Thermodesulfobacteriota bacterium]